MFYLHLIKKKSPTTMKPFLVLKRSRGPRGLQMPTFVTNGLEEGGSVSCVKRYLAWLHLAVVTRTALLLCGLQEEPGSSGDASVQRRSGSRPHSHGDFGHPSPLPENIWSIRHLRLQSGGHQSVLPSPCLSADRDTAPSTCHVPSATSLE